MTQEHAHHPSGPLRLAVTLALIAGFVDAHLYLHVTPVFVANMSGNLIHFGILFGEGDWAEAAIAVAAVVAFTTGVALGTVHHDRELRRRTAVRPGFLLLVEAVLVLAVPILIALLDVGFTTRPVARDYPIIVVAAIAMGLQASALRRVGEIAVATTYGTGAIVRIGEKVVLAVRRADRSTGHRRIVTVAVLVAVLLSYVAGAIVAALAGGTSILLVIVAATLAALALMTGRPDLEVEPSAA